VFASNRGASALYELRLADGLVLQAAEDRHGRGLRPPGSRVGLRLRGEACALVGLPE
jgi:hypothetical protein